MILIRGTTRVDNKSALSKSYEHTMIILGLFLVATLLTRWSLQDRPTLIILTLEENSEVPCSQSLGWNYFRYDKRDVYYIV